MRSLIIKRTCFFLFSFVLLVAVSAATEGAVNPDYLWEMSPGYGNDSNLDGRIDIPNTRAYAVTNNFDITITLTDHFFKSRALPTEKTGSIELKCMITGRDYSQKKSSTGRSITLEQVPCGRLGGQLEVLLSGRNFKIPLVMTPRRLLIASIGDSYSSGEGVPERRYRKENLSVWADGGSASLEVLNHTRAHRSSLAWPSQAALTIEMEDPHSSVIFIFLAASGATIESGLLGPYGGIDKSLKGRLSPQVQRLAELTEGEVIDTLTIGIGGNDIGIVRAAVFSVLYDGGINGKRRKQYSLSLESMIESVQDGVWDCPGSRLMGYHRSAKRPGLNGLSESYRELHAHLEEKIEVRESWLVSYPLPVVAGVVALDDLFPGFEMDAYESEALVNAILGPLTAIMKSSAKEFGWNYLNVSEAFDYSQHHYGMAEPYPPRSYSGMPDDYPLSWPQFRDRYLNLPIRWIRSARESMVIQGANADLTRPGPLSTWGTVHPNEIGHQAVMHLFLQQVSLPDWYPIALQQQYSSGGPLTRKGDPFEASAAP